VLDVSAPLFRAPWRDRRGRFSALRAATFTLLLLPAAYYLSAWVADALGARPRFEVLRAAGLWTAWFLLLSLAVTPARATLALPQLPPLRRMIGLGALAYALGHLALYSADQGWHMVHVASEIANRFYLTVGLTALLGLAVLGWTSTDGWVRTLGASWKRLHRAAYAVAALAAWHFMLQAKADVSLGLLSVGVLAWLLLWRLLPAGRDRSLLPLLGLAVAAAAVTAVIEWVWFRFGTKLDPWRVVGSELVLRFGPRPAVQVLFLGVVAALAVELRRLAILGSAGRAWYPPLAYAAGSALATFALATLKLSPFPPQCGTEAVWIALLALLGVARSRLQLVEHRRWLDLFYTACLLHPIWMANMDLPTLAPAADVAVALAAAVLAARLWVASRGAALMLAPLVAWAAFSATTLL
jgi:methionine sulfoxide reductase heme-binding subunit